jgi:hypothetical protein
MDIDTITLANVTNGTSGKGNIFDTSISNQQN